MEYKYKGELEAKYKVEASFYYRNIGEEQVLCRRAANIKKINCENEPLDAYFVMMNPGKCKCIDVSQIAKNENMEFSFSPSRADPTMVRIMNIMDELGWKNIRIINISDIVEPDSKKVRIKVSDIIKNGYHAHCVFSEERRDELEYLTKENAVYVMAFGVSKEINYYVPLCMKYLENKNCVGAKNKYGQYLHIRPTLKENQIKVAEQIIEQINAL